MKKVISKASEHTGQLDCSCRKCKRALNKQEEQEERRARHLANSEVKQLSLNIDLLSEPERVDELDHDVDSLTIITVGHLT